MKELIATIHCPKCAEQKAEVHGIEAGHGVRQNVTEPQTYQGLKQCPDCGETLEVRRVG